MGVFLTLIFVCTQTVAALPSASLNPKVQKISGENASQRWATFSQSVQAKTFVFDFKLTHYPRQAEEVEYFGTMYGKETSGKTLIRLTLKGGGKMCDYLFIRKNARDIFAYKFENNSLKKIPESELNSPIKNGLIYTYFDILTPYKFWESEYLEPVRIGQAAYLFLAKSPKKKVLPDVKIALSREFNHPVLTQVLDENGMPQRSFTLGSVKKIGDYWIMKNAEIRDEISRDRDKFSIIRASLNENIDDNIFKPENLGKQIDTTFNLKKL